jgi:hypothetical protein
VRDNSNSTSLDIAAVDNELYPFRNRTVLENFIGSQFVPQHICDSLLAHVTERLRIAGFIIGLVFPHPVTSVPTNTAGPSSNALIPLSSSQLRDCVKFMQPHLVCLNLKGFPVNDDVLTALSQSLISSTLQTLDISWSSITDGSSSNWRPFKNLRRLDISHCKWIGEKTLRSVSQLPSLQLLTARLMNHLDQYVIQHILGPRSLPSLTELRLALSPLGSNLESIVAALQGRKASTSLKVAEFFSPALLDWSTQSFASRLHKWMPNLTETISTWTALNDLRALGDSSKNLQRLHLKETIIDQVFVSAVSELAPSLRILQVTAESMAHDVRFSEMDTLESIRIVTAAPSSVLGAAAIFVKNLAVLSSQLDSIEVVNAFEWEESDVSLLLHSFPNLKKLQLTSPSGKPDGGRDFLFFRPKNSSAFNLSHPSLETIPRYAELANRVPVIQALPSVISANLSITSETEIETVCGISPSSTPHLLHLSVDATPGANSSRNEQAAQAIGKMAPYLSSLHLTLSLNSTAISSILQRLRYITKLSLHRVELTSKTASELIMPLKWLTYLMMSVPGSSWDWFKHDRLVEAFILADQGGGILLISSKSLPMLRTLRCCYFGTICVEGDSLEHLQIDTTASDATVQVQNCPQMISLRIEHAYLARLVITEVPNLRELRNKSDMAARPDGSVDKKVITPKDCKTV